MSCFGSLNLSERHENERVVTCPITDVSTSYTSVFGHLPGTLNRENYSVSQLLVEVSIGELIDKVTILQIKSERIKDRAKLINIHTELSLLNEVLEREVHSLGTITHLVDDLKKINEVIWDVEDSIRDLEKKQVFDEAFIKLARKVYHSNDRRAALKRDINLAMQSRIIEEKSYSQY